MGKKRKRGGKKSSNQLRNQRKRRDRNRIQAHSVVAGAYGEESIDIALPEDECAFLFSVEGGRVNRHDNSDKIGKGSLVYLNGRKPPRARVPRIMGIERDKASEMMRNADDAYAIRLRKDALREIRESERESELYDAHKRGSLKWVRQNGDHEGQFLRSVLASTSLAEGDHSTEWASQIYGYRDDAGIWRAGIETWNGELSEPDKFGDRSRIGVESELFTKDGVALSFVSEKHMQRSISFAISEGKFDTWSRQHRSPRFRERMAKRLSHWSHAATRDDDGRARLRHEGDRDFEYKAEIGSERKLRNEGGFDLLTEVQLANNLLDSE